MTQFRKCGYGSEGNFFCLIVLPSGVDADKAKASYNDGVLEVTLPKAMEVRPKRIALSAEKKG